MISSICYAIITLFLVVSTVSGQEQTTLDNPVPNANSKYGRFLKGSAEDLLVSWKTCKTVNNEISLGAIYRRLNDDWKLNQILKCSNPQFTECEIISVSLSDNSAIIGIEVQSSRYVYLFEKMGSVWSMVSRMTISDAKRIDYGASVAINSQYAFVGATHDNVNASNSGLVYVYEKFGSTWKLSFKLVPEASLTAKAFGSSLVCSSHELVVGSVKSNNVFIYQIAEGFPELMNVKGPEGAHNFGFDVAINNGMLAIAAPKVYSGEVYIYRKTRGSYQRIIKLTSWINSHYFLFANSIALGTDFIAVGSAGELLNVPVAVYPIKQDSLSDPTVFVAGEKSSYYGRNIAFVNNYVFVSSRGDKSLAGAVYIYKLDQNK